MFGQTLVFGVARNTLARRLGRQQLNADDLPEITRIVERSAMCALVGSAGEGTVDVGHDVPVKAF